MNVHDWLANLPFSDPESNCRIVEVSFNNGSRKDYFKNTTLHYYGRGEMIAVEGVNGFDVGMVNLTGELVRLQLKKNKIDEKSPEIKKVLRRATEQDISKMMESKAKEANMLIRSRAIARHLRLELKMDEVESKELVRVPFKVLMYAMVDVENGELVRVELPRHQGIHDF